MFIKPSLIKGILTMILMETPLTWKSKYNFFGLTLVFLQEIAVLGQNTNLKKIDFFKKRVHIFFFYVYTVL